MQLQVAQCVFLKDDNCRNARDTNLTRLAPKYQQRFFRDRHRKMKTVSLIDKGRLAHTSFIMRAHCNGEGEKLDGAPCVQFCLGFCCDYLGAGCSFATLHFGGIGACLSSHPGTLFNIHLRAAKASSASENSNRNKHLDGKQLWCQRCLRENL